MEVFAALAGRDCSHQHIPRWQNGRWSSREWPWVGGKKEKRTRGVGGRKLEVGGKMVSWLQEMVYICRGSRAPRV